MKTQKAVDWIEARYNTSNKYNVDYAHLEDWKYLKWNFRILSNRVDVNITDYGSISNTLRVKTDKKISKKIIYRVLRDYFASGCSCSHDCCGCYFGGLSNLKKPSNRRNNEYIATLCYSPNI